MKFSVIVPVYNRAEEVDELLQSLTAVSGADMEVIIVEDGSDIPCEDVVRKYEGKLDVKYFFKENTGPGLTRNYGAEQASGSHLVFFDSDCIIPSGYFEEVEKELVLSTCDGWGGPDRAAESFSPVQKAINYAMTSFLTTGGIRGKAKGKMASLDKFYARSFNMGMRREVFEAVGGFSTMRVGEDIDLSSRLFANGYTVRLFPEAWVYHKRRTDLWQFWRQVYKFGKARVKLSWLHPGTMKLVHMLPALFVTGLAVCLLMSFVCPWVLLLPAVYLTAVFIDSSLKNKSAYIGILSVPASFIQLCGYGLGFISALLHTK